MNKTLSLLFIGLFLLAICTPLAVMYTTEEQQISYSEKRKLAPKPQWHFTRESVNGFPRRYEAYFNDHFGLRNRLVQLYNGFFVTFLQTSPKTHTVVGKDKWLFIAANFTVHDYMGLNPVDDNQLRHWKEILLDRDEWLKDQQIRYLFILPPNKIMIYPEYLPERIRKRAGTTNLQLLLDELAAPPQFRDILDLRPALLAAKSSNQLYHKGDTHWNFDGSYVAYVEIMKRLGQWFDDMQPVAKESLIPEHQTLSGDLTYTLNLAQMYRENITILHRPDEEKVINFRRFPGYPQPNQPYQIFNKGTLWVNENPAKKISAVFISDSFGSALRNYLAPHFKKIIHVRDARFEDMKRLIEEEHPDVILDLNVARGFYVALRENIEIRDYILAKNHKTRVIVQDITPQNLPDNLTGSRNVHLETSEGKMTVGHDPQLYLKLPEVLPAKPLTVYCQVESSSDSFLTLYYQTKDHLYFGEDQKIITKMRRGPNALYFRIFEPVAGSTIRLDIAELPGRYALQRFTLSVERSLSR